MARYCPGFETDSMFEVAKAIKDRCFREDLSIFSDEKVWTEDNARSLLDLYTNNIDKGEGGYLEKMESQIEGASPEQCQLMAEMNYLLVLPQSNISSGKKIEIVETILKWCGKSVDRDAVWFSDDALQGAFNPGLAYNTQRWRELLYLMRIVAAFKALPTEKRETVLSDPWGFSNWLIDIDQEGYRQFQHVIKFLFFPESFERVVSLAHKRDFVARHLGVAASEFAEMTETELDRSLLKAREQYEKAYPDEPFDFYEHGDAERAAVEEPEAEYQAEAPLGFQSEYPLNVILYGPPGTGKTHHSLRRAVRIADGEAANEMDKHQLKSRYDALVEDGRVAFVTFHQSFCYEDFVEGLKAKTVDNTIRYFIDKGIFQSIAEKAQGDPKNGYVLIIDEINRGNVSSIFGELITLLESSKREDASDAVSVTLPYSKKPFSVPSNLYLIGTMNTADRSLVHLDTALRRRFTFEEVLPKPSVLEALPKIESVDIPKLLNTINQRIAVVYDRDHTIGHSYFMPLGDMKEPKIADLAAIFQNQILPLLEEYFFEDWQRIRQVLADDRKPQGVLPIYTQAMSDQDFFRLMGDDWQGARSIVWERNHQALASPETYKSIYE